MSTKRIAFLLSAGLILLGPAAPVCAQTNDVPQAEARHIKAAQIALATVPETDKPAVREYIELLHQWYQSPLPVAVKVKPVERLFAIYADLLRSRTATLAGSQLTAAQRISLCSMYNQAIQDARANIEDVKAVLASQGIRTQPEQLAILEQLTGQQEAIVAVLQADVVSLVMPKHH